MAGAGGDEIGAAIDGLKVKRERKTAATVTPVMTVVLMKDSELGFGVFVT